MSGLVDIKANMLVIVSILLHIVTIRLHIVIILLHIATILLHIIILCHRHVLTHIVTSMETVFLQHRIILFNLL